ncbi:MAG: hypothetical protein NTZ05_09675 [Chloroflexi bacterium]|nr:hypothetical protein [Chloroflexota bacterium]
MAPHVKPPMYTTLWDSIGVGLERAPSTALDSLTHQERNAGGALLCALMDDQLTENA